MVRFVLSHLITILIIKTILFQLHFFNQKPKKITKSPYRMTKTSNALGKKNNYLLTGDAVCIRWAEESAEFNVYFPFDRLGNVNMLKK